MTALSRAIIFDFNGVIADDEGPHLSAFQQALREHGLELTAAEYYGTYLGMDERNCLEALLIARAGKLDEALAARIHMRKAELFREHCASSPPPLFAGAAELVESLRPHYRLAIASGGRRGQIDAALRGTPIAQHFDVVVAAEDVAVGKPDPAIYRLTLDRLNAIDRARRLEPADCLVVEDSRAGIASARAAGMRVVAVATTYRADDLAHADAVVSSLKELTAERVNRLLQSRPR